MWVRLYQDMLTILVRPRSTTNFHEKALVSLGGAMFFLFFPRNDAKVCFH